MDEITQEKEFKEKEKTMQDKFLIQRLDRSKGICNNTEEKVEREGGRKKTKQNRKSQQRTILSNQDLDEQLKFSVPVSSS